MRQALSSLIVLFGAALFLIGSQQFGNQDLNLAQKETKNSHTDLTYSYSQP